MLYFYAKKIKREHFLFSPNTFNQSLPLPDAGCSEGKEEEKRKKPNLRKKCFALQNHILQCLSILLLKII